MSYQWRSLTDRRSSADGMSLGSSGSRPSLDNPNKTTLVPHLGTQFRRPRPTLSPKDNFTASQHSKDFKLSTSFYRVRLLIIDYRLHCSFELD